MSASRLRLFLVKNISLTVVLLGGLVSGVGERENAVLGQATGAIAMVLAAGVLILTLVKLKHCRERATPQLRKVHQRFAVLWMMIFVTGTFLIALRSRTPSAWFLFATFLAAFSARWLWDRYRSKDFTDRAHNALGLDGSGSTRPR